MENSKTVLRKSVDEREAIRTPEGVRFFPSVVRIPTLPAYFNRPLWAAGHCEGEDWLCHFGDWVTVGTPICKFSVLPEITFMNTLFSFRQKEHILEIVSPVNGLMISPGCKTFDDQSAEDNAYLCAIIPARPNALPESAEIAYRKFSNTVQDCKEMLFSRGTWMELDENMLNKQLSELQGRPLQQRPLSQYQDRIDELWRAKVSGWVIDQLQTIVSTQ